MWRLPFLLVLTSLVVGQERGLSRETHTYAEVGGRPLQLDLYASEAQAPTPLVIWIHGGAWRGGSRAHVPEPVRALVREGVSVASIEYRPRG